MGGKYPKFGVGVGVGVSPPPLHLAPLNDTIFYQNNLQNNQKSKQVMILINVGACMTEFEIATFYLKI